LLLLRYGLLLLVGLVSTIAIPTIAALLIARLLILLLLRVGLFVVFDGCCCFAILDLCRRNR
jgi:hypothetical protein